MKSVTLVSDEPGGTRSPSLAPVFECPACGTEYNRETAQAKGLYCGCTPQLIFMRRLRR